MQITRIIFLIALCAYTVNSHATSEAMSDVASMLLISNNEEEAKLGARIIVGEDIDTAEVLDVAAHRLWVILQQGPIDQQADLIAWLVKALTVSPDGRYQELLLEARTVTDAHLNDRHAAKVHIHIKKAMNAIEQSEPGNAFTIQHESIAALRASVMDSRSPSTAFVTSGDIKKGDHATVVFDKLGQPFRVMQHLATKFVPVAGNIRLQQVQIHYPGTAVVLARRKSVWQVASAEPLIGTDELIANLSSANPDVYGEAAVYVAHTQQNDEEILDLIARRAWENAATNDRRTIKGVISLCNTLGLSGNNRYRDILIRIFNSASDRYVKLAVQKSLDKLDDTVVEQFRIHEVSTASNNP